MDKLKFETPDMVAGNIEKIGALFPAAVTEMRGEDGQIKKGINFEVLKQLLSRDVVDGDECYEFTWVGKKAAMAEAARPITKTLRPVKEDSRDWDTTQNLYIEGDNLDVLKILQESYLGKVKMIYIDPPYNTGHDFIYRDKFQRSQQEENEQMGMYDEDENQMFENTESNGRFHSDWCSYIYRPLILARNLLTDDGVILINMDENEITNLQKICLDVFGEANDLGTIIWDKRNPKGDARGISCQHEYILVYAKNKDKLLETCDVKRPKRNAQVILNKAKQLFSQIDGIYTLENANRDFAAWIREQVGFSGGEKAYNKIDENGEPYQSVSMAWPNKKKAPDDYFIPLIHPVTHKPCPVPERGWRNPSATMRDLQRRGKIIFGIDETTQPRSKYLLRENMHENVPSLIYYGGSDVEMLSKMGIPFDTPKVVELCIEHIKTFVNSEDIILDFFSGSATIAHAVMQLNAQDKGQRKFIMVQFPEPCDQRSEAYKAGFKNICEIGKERIRRAGDKIQRERLEAIGFTKHEWDQTCYYVEHQEECDKLGHLPDSYFEKKFPEIDTGFRVFRVDSSNMKDVHYQPEELEQVALGEMVSNIKDDRTDMDLLYACLLDWGVEIHLPHTSTDHDGCTIHNVDNGALMACFNPNVPTSVVEFMAKQQPLRAVFRDSAFASDDAKINVTEIFKNLSPDTKVKVI